MIGSEIRRKRDEKTWFDIISDFNEYQALFESKEYMKILHIYLPNMLLMRSEFSRYSISYSLITSYPKCLPLRVLFEKSRLSVFLPLIGWLFSFQHLPPQKVGHNITHSINQVLVSSTN